MTLASGTKLGPYEIHSPLGAGGMGEVYRATDTKLGRDIALKVLPAEMAHDPERLARFRREAKALAQLDHPNIVTIHSVEECDGVHFLTMQLVEGQPLDRLITSGGLPVEQIVEIASALGDALAAAHEKGIVHRDLKPGNVMVSSEGRVKVLDFGLAKDVRTSSAGDATLTSASQTQVGVVMGTPAYMSPEQTSGRALDHRTDIFSLGVVLHEMATGHRPFEGNSSAELVSAILRDAPPSVSDVRPDLPSDLARIIRRCLEKDPRHRVQTARDVSNEFRDLSRQTSQKVIRATTSITRAAAADSDASRADEGFWVAVLPFKYSGGNADLTALSEGLTQDIVTGLSRFSYLRVIVHGSTAKYSLESADVRAIGKELGARYVMEGSVRQTGSRIRVAVQLVDAVSRASLWAETYERPLRPDAAFDLQDELVPVIVSTVADTHGVLPRTMSESLRGRAPGTLSPYEAVVRCIAYQYRITAEEHAIVVEGLEHAVQQAPGYAPAWSMLAHMYKEEYAHCFNLRPDGLERACAAARRAIEAAPADHLAYYALAAASFFRREWDAFRSATQRAITLNPMDGFVFGYLGMLTAYAGDWERGCAMSERARTLNPHHPSWYWFTPLFDAYNKGQLRDALGFAQKVNMPGFWRTPFAFAVIYGHLGELEAAREAVRTLLSVRPHFAEEGRQECLKWWQPDLAENLIDGLHKAGLEIPNDPAKPNPSPTATTSGAARADEGFWVAVLPFKYAGTNAELKALADGLSEEVVTGLSRFSYLRVIARGSTAKYSSEAGDVRAIGKELGARFVMEGSLRQAGSKLRLAVQLVDTVSGAHLWAENYERTFSPEAVFELQDDLVPRIVSTVADMNGTLPRSMSEVLRSRPPEQLSPYEAVLRSFAYPSGGTPEELAAARSGLEEAVRKAPSYADAWAMLSFLCGQDYVHGFELQANALEIAASAARRAVALGPSNHLAYFSLASVLWYQKDYDSFRDAAERAVALNPMDGNSVAFMGELLTYTGNAERGMQLAERAKQLNPNHPGWYWYADFYQAFSQGDYRGALAFALKVKLHGNPLAPMMIAAACGHLGDIEGGAKAAADLVKFRPELPAIMRKQVAKVWNPDYGERFLEGLRKAGLEIPAAGAAAPSATGSPATRLSTTSTVRTISGEGRADEGFWVAVLPFKYAGTSTELKALADGLSEEIVTGLSRFSYLRVIARGSTAKYSGETGDVRTIAKELGARYVMEGSLRHAGNKLRIAVQLVDAVSGAHLWAETYERAFRPESVFELQDDLVPRIVSTVADMNGILARSMSELVRSRPPEQLSPYEAVLRSFGYFERMTPDDLVATRSGLESAVEKAPTKADAWAMLALLYVQDHAQGFNLQAESLTNGLAAARRAVEAGPSDSLAYLSLAQSLFFLKEFQSFRNVAEKAVALNPMDGNSLASLGAMVCYAGDWERGLALAGRAKQLNPNHPGWYWLIDAANGFRRREYRNALNSALKVNLPRNLGVQTMVAAAYGQLGEKDAAAKAMRDLLKARPNIAATVRKDYERWWNTKDAEPVMEGLGKAGLEIAHEPGTQSSAFDARSPSAQNVSGPIRAEEGFWVAVLPFRYSGSNSELTALAEGLTEDILTGLSRFSYLKVIARSSSSRYANEAVDIRVAGKELGARYVMEGSLRQAGNKLRLAVQLVDATTGAHLWAENYERTYAPEHSFALQDDLVPRIVATVADQSGVLTRSMSEVLRSKNEDQLTPHESVLRAFSYFERINPEEHATVRRVLERAVEVAPQQADCWAMLSMLYRGEYAQGFNPRPDPLSRALAAAQRAVDIAPSNHLAYYSQATTLFFQKDKFAFRVAAEKALALNRMDGTSVAFLGMLTAYSGEWERGCALVESAMQLNPNHPGWYRVPMFANAYNKGAYREALDAALRINSPGYFHSQAALAAAAGQLGQRETAQKAVRDLLALKPDFSNEARREYAKWYSPELVEHLIEGLRKAGLEISDPPD